MSDQRAKVLAFLEGETVDETLMRHLELELAPYDDVERLKKYKTQVLMRASSAARAETLPRPRAKTRRDFQASDVTRHDTRRPYTEFFALEEMRISHQKFGGGRSEIMNRAGFVAADAVTVMPYDPKRDRVLLIEQMRVGPLMRHDPRPWMLEVIAGRIDPGDSPEETARKEAREEANIELSELHLVGEMYPSSGAFSEYLYSYVGIADLPDDITGVAGLESEHEDIASYLMDFDTLMTLCDESKLDTAPVFLSALWLYRNRARLR